MSTKHDFLEDESHLLALNEPAALKAASVMMTYFTRRRSAQYRPEPADMVDLFLAAYFDELSAQIKNGPA